MRRLVETDADLDELISDVLANPIISLDTESYGGDWNHSMFALQFATATNQWYLNFHEYFDGTCRLNKGEIVKKLTPIWESKSLIVAMHNAKFDLRRLAIEEVFPKFLVHCSQMCERFVYNQYMRYSLAACAKRRGMEKDDRVAEYINEHKLWTMVDGKKWKHFDQVPFNIMFEYGCIDVEVCLAIAIDQHEKLKAHTFYWNDLALEKVAYGMEHRGFEVRKDYAIGGLIYEQEQQRIAEEILSELACEPFRNGPKWLSAIFDKHKVPYSRNPKTNNPVFDKKALGEISHPIAEQIMAYRRHEKYASTYYSHYVKHDVVHAEIKLWGTDTGRFSYAEPNLQNVPKEESLCTDIPYQVRGCFRPREDYVLVCIDYDQQEFRLLLDYAGEMELIKEINELGLDVHQVTANSVGISRTQAKTLNFALLYGMGIEKLSNALKVDEYTAKQIKSQYFARLPRVKGFIGAVISKAERTKEIKTWCGRSLHFPNKDFAYAAPNHLIQGGCGDIARFAMTAIAEQVLEGTKSALLLQVHDELVFEFHKDELDLIDPIVRIMETTYRPFNGMKLTCGVDHSFVSWGKRDIIKGKPSIT